MPQDPIHRKYHHDDLTFTLLYAFTENFCCRSRTTKWCTARLAAQQDAGRPVAEVRQPARCSTATCRRTPARSCCSWASEFGQWREWNSNACCSGTCCGIRTRASSAWCGDLNRSTRRAALHRRISMARFRVDRLPRRDQQSVLAPAQGPDHDDMVCFNFTPVPRHKYRLGVPLGAGIARFSTATPVLRRQQRRQWLPPAAGGRARTG